MTLQDMAKEAEFTITGCICSIFCLSFLCTNALSSMESRIMIGMIVYRQQWSDIYIFFLVSPWYSCMQIEEED